MIALCVIRVTGNDAYLEIVTICVSPSQNLKKCAIDHVIYPPQILLICREEHFILNFEFPNTEVRECSLKFSLSFHTQFLIKPNSARKSHDPYFG